MNAPLPWRRLRRALLRPPSVEVSTAEAVARWGYERPRDLDVARAQHSTFRHHLESEGVEVVLHEAELPGCADACFACDPALITPLGAIILRLGKALREPEAAAMESTLRAIGYPVAGRIEAPGTVEGGDCLWLDESTLAVGDGYRTNRSGQEQLRSLLPGVEIRVFQLPWHTGPADCMHLQSLLSFVDDGLALVHLPMAPVALVRALEERAVRMIPLAPEELDTLGSNILCTAPGRVVMSAGNPRTAGRLRDAGVQVTELVADDLMRIATGGPTCLTLPLDRG